MKLGNRKYDEKGQSRNMELIFQLQPQPLSSFVLPQAG